MNELLDILLRSGMAITFTVENPGTRLPNMVKAQIELNGVIWSGWAESPFGALHAATVSQIKSLIAK